jgi:FkbM family methyltransferase
MGSDSASHRYARYLRAWLDLLVSRRGRRALAWYVDQGVAESVRMSGTVPQVAWAQDGEDLFLDEGLPSEGFFVDVGAHHPDRFSVTRKLSDKGWVGVNIDVSPDFTALFAARRPRDINVRSLVGTRGEGEFWHFDEAALSTLDAQRAEQLVAEGWRLGSRESLPVRTLTDILDSVGTPATIDLLSVDVEGADLDVLMSLDWRTRRVSRCLVELAVPACAVAEHPIAVFLAERGLSPSRVWGRSCLFEVAG